MTNNIHNCTTLQSLGAICTKLITDHFINDKCKLNAKSIAFIKHNKKVINEYTFIEKSDCKK